MTDFEPVGTGDWHLAGPNKTNPRFAGTLFTPKPQLVEGELITFGLHFHPAVIEIADPAAEAKFKSTSSTGLPKTNALNGSFHQKTPAFLKSDRSLPGVAGHKAATFRFAAKASAARHLQGIVEDPPQWRWTQLAWRLGRFHPSALRSTFQPSTCHSAPKLPML